MKRTVSQNNRIHGLLAKRRLGQEDKARLVYEITGGRTSKSSEMNFHEAKQLIKQLDAGSNQQEKKDDPADTMRKKIIHYFHNMGWQKQDGSADMMKIEGWMLNKSYLNKAMNDYSITELPKLVSQVQSMHQKHLNSI